MKKLAIVLMACALTFGLFCMEREPERTPGRIGQRRRFEPPPGGQMERPPRRRRIGGHQYLDPIIGHIIRSLAKDSIIRTKKWKGPGWFEYWVQNFRRPEGVFQEIANIFLDMKGVSLDKLVLDPRRVAREDFFRVFGDPAPPGRDIFISLIIDYKGGGAQSYSTRDIFASEDLLELLRRIQRLYRKKMKPIKIRPKTKKYYDIIIRTDKEEMETPKEPKQITPKEEKKLKKELLKKTKK